MSNVPKKPGGGRQSTRPDYHTIEVPDEKSPTDYTYAQRRAEILQYICEHGSPYNLPAYEKLGQRYDVAEPTISKDMRRLREYVVDTLGDDVAFEVRMIYEKTVTELQDQGKWKKAWDVVMEFHEWLADAGYVNDGRFSESGSGSILDGTETIETDDYTLTVTSEVVDAGEGTPVTQQQES